MIKNLKCYKGMLIVVDMVNGFVKKGVLHDSKIGNIIPRQIELIKESHQKENLIVFIKDTHEKDSIEHKRFPAPHCVRGSGEELVVDELSEYLGLDNTVLFVRDANNIKNVDIVGCCTDICVFNGAMGLANYYDQVNRDVNIRVHQDAVATYAEDVRKNYVDAAYLLMEQQGIKLVKKR